MDVHHVRCCASVRIHCASHLEDGRTMTLPPDYTRCRDDKCPQRWECARWAPPWDAHTSSGPVSFVTTLRDADGECLYQIVVAERVMTQYPAPA